MSNTTQETQAFLKLAAQDKDINPKVTLVDGAQGGLFQLQFGNDLILRSQNSANGTQLPVLLVTPAGSPL